MDFEEEKRERDKLRLEAEKARIRKGIRKNAESTYDYETGEYLDITARRELREELSKKKEKKKKVKKPKSLGYKYAKILFSAAMVIIMFTVASQVGKIVQLKIDKRNAAAELAKLEEQRDDLQNKYDNLDSDETIEKQAREILKMAKTGEIIYVFDDDDVAGSTGGSESQAGSKGLGSVKSTDEDKTDDDSTKKNKNDIEDSDSSSTQNGSNESSSTQNENSSSTANSTKNSNSSSTNSSTKNSNSSSTSSSTKNSNSSSTSSTKKNNSSSGASSNGGGSTSSSGSSSNGRGSSSNSGSSSNGRGSNSSTGNSSSGGHSGSSSGVVDD